MHLKKSLFLFRIGDRSIQDKDTELFWNSCSIEAGKIHIGTVMMAILVIIAFYTVMYIKTNFAKIFYVKFQVPFESVTANYLRFP